MTPRPLTALARKEVRALLPLAASTLVALVAITVLGPRATPAALMAFAAGTAALGAWSVGHEYAERTLAPLLLAQPLGRGRILATKLAVLSAMLLGLSVMAQLLLPVPRQLAGSAAELPWFVPGAALSALCLAPASTLLCRSALGGAVFSVAIPLNLWLGSYLLVPEPTATTGVVPGPLPPDALPGLTPLFALVWVGGAALAWYLFVHLQVVDGGRAFAGSLAGSDRLARHAAGPLRSLVLKELRLQTMALVVAALFVTVWLTLRYAKGGAVSGASPLLPTVIFQLLLMSLLVGALSSAEERQLGTIEWQLLQPVPQRTQWAIKVAVALLTALVLAVGLPATLHALWPPADRMGSPFWFSAPLVVLAFTTVAIYVSSVSRSALGALLASVPVIGAVALVAAYLAQLVGALVIPTVSLPLALWLARNGWLADAGATPMVGFGLVLACLAVAAAPFLAAARGNHARRPSSIRRYGAQAVWIGCGLAASVLLLALVWPVARWSYAGLPGPAAMWIDPPFHSRPQPHR